MSFAGPVPPPTRASRAWAVSLLALPFAAASCNSPPVRMVREVPVVGTVMNEVLPAPPFPQGWRVVDLTSPLDPSSPRMDHPRQFPFERLDLGPTTQGSARTGAITMMEHAGTHLASPSTRGGGDTIERWDAEDLLIPLVVVDVSGALESATAQAIEAHESSHGRIERGCAVLLRTRPGSRRPTGWSEPAVRILAAERGVRVIGCEGAALDAADDSRSGAAQKAAAEAGSWQLLSVRSLDQVPNRGAWIMIGALPIAGAAGSPARVVALVPPEAKTPTTASSRSGR